MENKTLKDTQVAVLKELAPDITGFYLSGGTALSLFYFQHRDSQDLDFFTPKFSPAEIRRIVKDLAAKINAKVSLVEENLSGSSAKFLIYQAQFSNKRFLKIDFVQDFLEVLKPFKVVDGVKILSLEDIYLRKIFAVSGAGERLDETGRHIGVGFRQEAKDLLDIYFLSRTFMPLSEFSFRYCDQARKEGLIRWFRTFDRLKMKSDMLELRLKKDIEFLGIEKHLKQELDKIIEKEIE